MTPLVLVAKTAKVGIMVLSDSDIKREVKKKHILISPFDPKCVQPASYDLKLGREFRVFKSIHKAYFDVKKNSSEDFIELIKIKDSSPLIVHPGEFILARTIETVGIPRDLIGRLEGKSSLGRIGIIVHATAGFIDPGFKGTLTLEMTNVANIPIALYPGMRIAQISFMRMESPAEVPYGEIRGSKYWGQVGPTPSKISEDFKKK